MDYPLHSIYFYLTACCNLRCRHCWIEPEVHPPESASNFLDPDIVRHVLQQGKSMGVRTVKLSGGEPLLSPHFGTILDMIREDGLNLLLETNATLCTPKIAARIAGFESPFVAVSLDGACAETHDWMRGVPGCFEAALKGIENLVNQDIKPQVIMTIAKRNVEEMGDMVRLAEALGAGSVKFNIMQPIGKGEQFYADKNALSVESLMDISHGVTHRLQQSTALSVQFDQPIAFDPLNRIFSNSPGGCNLCGILGIISVIADGSYALCGIGRSIPELVFGHAASDRLDDVWNTCGTLREIRDGLPDRLEGVCARCILKALCLGRCIAHNYYRTQRLWGPFWYCEAVEKLGRFPATRSVFSHP